MSFADISTRFKTLSSAGLVLASLFLSTHTYAEEGFMQRYQNEACDVQVHADIAVNEERVTITNEAQDVFILTESGQASVNGRTLSLTSSEQDEVSAYVKGIEKAIPKAMALAAKAVDITNEALTEVFTGVLGEDSELPKLLNKKLKEVQKALEDEVYSSGQLDFDSRRLKSASFEEQTQFEKDIDAAIEEITSSAMAEIVVALGRSMLSGEGSMQDFEARMQAMGDNIDEAVTTQSQSLKEDANALCEDLMEIENHEKKLQQIDALNEINLLQVTLKAA